MLKHYALPFLLIGLLSTAVTQAQVKIGDDPQTIDPASILELQSSDKVLVITRVDETQMASIVPSRGALVYNTTAGCVFYYDGTQWINLCEAGSAGNLTADAIVNAESTIVITPTADGANFEVAPGSINSEQIVDGGINGIDIQDGSIGPGKLQDNSVTQEKLSENSVGAYALDNANINLSDFQNDQGFITGADIVSPDANNSITPDANGAAFFNAQPLQDGIDANAAAIAADGDTDATNEIQDITLTGDQLTISGGSTVTLPTTDGSDTKIIDGTNTTVSGAGTALSPYAINVTPDGDGSSTNELQDLDFNSTTNILTITNAATAGNEVDLSALAGGGDDDQTAAEVPAAATATNYIPTSADVEGHLAGIDAALATATTPNLSDVLTEGPDAGGTTINNLGTPLADADAATKKYVDDAITAGGNLENGKILIGDATDAPVSQTVTGDATLDNAGVLTINNDAITTAKILDANVSPEKIQPATAPIASDQMLITNSITNQVEWADIPTGTAAQNLGEVLGTGNSAGNLQIKDLGDPTAAQDAATKQYVDDEITASKALTDGHILVGDASNEAQEVELSGDATIDNTGVLTIEDEAVDSDKIANASIQLEDLSDMGATADGQVMRWNNTAGNWEIASAASHSGQPKSLFFADENGDPVQAFHPDNGNPSLIWDYEARKVGSTSYGALGIGLDGGTINNNVKVHIAEQVFGSLAYPLMIQNRVGGDTGGSAVGMLFAVETNSYGKGALVYERKFANPGYARGDFHFLQEQNANSDLPTLTDKAFTIKNNKDIVLYGGIDIDGLGTGTPGQVLKSTGTGVEWGDGGGGLSAVDITSSFTGDGTSGSPLDIADNAISTDELALNAVETDNIADNAVNAAKIADDAVGSAELADNAVTTLNINAGAVTTDKFANGAVTSEKIANNTILAEDLSDMGATTSGQVLKWNGTAWAPGTDDTSSIPYTAGAGLSLATNEFSVNVDDTTIGISGADQLEVKDDGITTAKIQDGQVQADDIAEDNVTIEKIKESATDGQVLTTSGSDVVWADPVNLSTNDITLTEDRTINLAGFDFALNGSGSVGIGTDTPSNKLHVTGAIRSQGFLNSNGVFDEPSYRFNGDTDTGMFRDSEDNLGFSTGGTEALRIDDNQNVGIGTTAPAEKLHVAGNIRAEGTLTATGDITTDGNFVDTTPDYVFQKYYLGGSELNEDYKFSSLSEIEKFTKEHLHLPGVKSAKEIKDQGYWSLTESTQKNLEKIEELFLHTIEQEKEIEKLKAEKEAMARELESIKKDLKDIKAFIKK